MKISAYLLSFYVLFLCLAPGVRVLAINRVSEKGCCEQCGRSAEQPSKPFKKPGKGAADRACNPFEMCKICAGLFSNLTIISFDPASYNLPKIQPLKEEAPKHLALDFWQPPKLS